MPRSTGALQFEGFPNAVIEAMAHSCAVISFDCPSGTRDIISSGDNGVLVQLNNSEEMTNALITLLSTPHQQQSLAKAASQVVSTYSEERLFASWATLLK